MAVKKKQPQEDEQAIINRLEQEIKNEKWIIRKLNERIDELTEEYERKKKFLTEQLEHSIFLYYAMSHLFKAGEIRDEIERQERNKEQSWITALFKKDVKYIQAFFSWN